MVTFLIVAGCWLAGSLLSYWLMRLLCWCAGVPSGRRDRRVDILACACMPLAFVPILFQFAFFWADPDGVRRMLASDPYP